MNQQKALIALRDQRSLLKHRFGVTRLGIFGSVARDEATDRSDLDVVVGEHPTLAMRVNTQSSCIEQ
jgi:uncharacterized protein